MMPKSNVLRLSAIFAGAALFLSACGDSSAPANDGESNDTGAQESAAPESVSIGITQIAEHPSLDAARDGCKDALLDAVYTDDTVSIDEQNAPGEMATAASIASKFAADGVDLVRSEERREGGE